MRPPCLLAALVLTLPCAAPLLAQVVLLPPEVLTPLPGVVQPTSVVVGDVDEDGNDDLVSFAGPFVFQLRVHLGDGAGGFVPQAPVTLVVGGALRLLAHLDQDAHLDLLLADGSTTAELAYVLRGNGDGTFGPPLPITTPLLPQYSLDWAVPGDLDGDGLLDLAATTGNQAAILRGAGDGSFSGLVSLPVVSIPFVLVRHMALVHLDGDGLLDVLVGSSGPFTGGSVFRIHPGQPGGQVGSPVDVPMSAFDAHAMLVADVNDDGRADLLAASSLLNVLVVRLGLGGTAFAPAVQTPLPGNPNHLAATDLDGDGHTDLLVGLSGLGALGALRGHGDGSFAAPVVLSQLGVLAAAHQGTLATTDLDDDGLPDLAVAQGGGGTQFAGRLLLVRNATYGADEPYLDLGGSLAGAQGHPVLLAEGTLVPGTPLALTLLNALPAALPRLVVGFSQLGAPFLGGTLWPALDRVVLLPGVDAAGQSSFAVNWPPTLVGAQLWLQAWFPDVAGPQGWAASSGIQLQAP